MNYKKIARELDRQKWELYWRHMGWSWMDVLHKALYRTFRDKRHLLVAQIFNQNPLFDLVTKEVDNVYLYC